MIAIIDYGMGNLRSVQKGFEKVGHPAVVTRDPADVRKAAKVVLPGVGAFEDAIAELNRLGLTNSILGAIDSGRPFLGICLGLQLLFERSYENGEHAGLGVLKGEVVRFQLPPQYSVPHMGWNQAAILRRPPILEGIADGSHFYFVHSYFVVPQDQAVVAVQTEYCTPFCAMVWRDNLFATQFHPEKSQADGLKVLKNFGDL
ncbi:MAG: imidazole glycerol phosphate synthase subunit HisH [Thermoguttaceae bacterium]